MTIRRSELDAGRVDLSEVVTGRRLAPVHPGAILRDEFLEPLELSVYAVAGAMSAGHHHRYGSAPRPLFWQVANRTLRKQIEREVSPRAA